MSYYGQASGCLSSQTLADSDPRHLHSVNINANAANTALSGAEHELNVLLNNRQEEFAFCISISRLMEATERDACMKMTDS